MGVFAFIIQPLDLGTFGMLVICIPDVYNWEEFHKR